MMGSVHASRAPLVALLLAVVVGCRTPAATEPEPRTDSAPLSFSDVPVRALQTDPAAHVGDVFVERFLFFRVWWSPDRARPHQRTTELPTHFEARIVAAPLYVARIEFPASEDDRYDAMRDGTELCLRVRFLRLQPVSDSPVFALENRADRCPGARLP
jgi:hypothetical protein